MSLPSRDAWTKLRDKNAVPKGALKGVEIGPLLEAFVKAGRDWNKKVKLLEKMLQDFQKYHSALLESKDSKVKQFAPIFKKIILDGALREEESVKKMASGALSLKSSLESTISQGKVLLQGQISANDYSLYWLSEQVRLVHMKGTLVAQDVKELADPVKKWSTTYNLVGPPNLGDDPVKRNQAVKALIAAAGVLDAAAKKLNLY